MLPILGFPYDAPSGLGREQRDKATTKHFVIVSDYDSHNFGPVNSPANVRNMTPIIQKV
ncbi:MAG TPA: hypothetical protein VGL72_03285 [Bryobacteraceae bacterium]